VKQTDFTTAYSLQDGSHSAYILGISPDFSLLQQREALQKTGRLFIMMEEAFGSKKCNQKCKKL
jgi:hypothetical protein